MTLKRNTGTKFSIKLQTNYKLKRCNMQNTLLNTTMDVSKQIAAHPFLSFISALGLLVFEYAFDANSVIATTYAVFLILIVLDWLSGTSAAKKDGIDVSKYSIDGIKSTAVILSLPILARLLDVVMGTDVIIMGVVTAMLARGIARSVIANVKRAEWQIYIPQAWLDWVSDELAHKDARALERLKKINGEKEGKK